MPHRWRVVDCTQLEGKILSVRGGLEIHPHASSSVRVPLEDVAVVLLGLKATISTGALFRLVDSDVAVLFCNWQGVPQGGAYGWSKHSRIAARKKSQANASLPRLKHAWQQIVKAKIRGQANVIEHFNFPNFQKLNSLAKTVLSGDPHNVEAMAARFYWETLFADRDFNRSPGLGIDATNIALDYGYTVLRGIGIRAVLSAGIEPALGIHHHSRNNPFCLVDDLIEPFRPLVDSVVAQLGLDTFEKPERAALVKAVIGKFGKNSNCVSSEFEALAQCYGKYLEDSTTKIVVPIWEPV